MPLPTFAKTLRPPKSFARRLSELVLIAVILAALVILGGALGRSAWRVPFAPPPRIGIRLGDDWDAILAQSNYHFRNAAHNREGYSISFVPLDVTYTDPRHPLALPNSYGLLFQFEQGRVNRISISQYGEVVEWEETVEKIRMLVTAIQAAGWKQNTAAETMDARLARMKAYYDDPEHKNFMSDQFLGSWRGDDGRLDLTVYRNTVAGEKFQRRTVPNDIFSVILSFVRDESAANLPARGLKMELR